LKFEGEKQKQSVVPQGMEEVYISNKKPELRNSHHQKLRIRNAAKFMRTKG